jgi:hypothetical protein
MAKKKSNGRRGIVYRSNPPQLLSAASEHIADFVNPFSPSAKGTKIHDANAANTFTVQTKTLYQIGVNNAGSCCVDVYPTLEGQFRTVDPAVAFLNASGFLTNGATFSSSDASIATTLQNNSLRMRVVSWGIRLISLSSALDASGQLVIREIDEVNAKDYGLSKSMVSPTDNWISVPHTHDMDLTILPNHNGESYYNFRGPDWDWDQEDTLELDHAWRAINITGTGIKASGSDTTAVSTFQLEVVMNMECQPVFNTLGSIISSPAAPHHVEKLAAINNTRTKLALVHKTPSLWSKVKATAKNVLSTVGHYALDRLTGGVSSAVENFVSRQRPTMIGGSYPLLLTNG